MVAKPDFATIKFKIHSAFYTYMNKSKRKSESLATLAFSLSVYNL